MEKEKGYNGWSNYETWAVKLWLDNEEPSYRETVDQARCFLSEAKETEDGEKAHTEAVNRLAETLKDECESGWEALVGTNHAGVYGDLMGAAIGEVDWYEIAEAYISDTEYAEAFESKAKREAE